MANTTSRPSSLRTTRKLGADGMGDKLDTEKAGIAMLRKAALEKMASKQRQPKPQKDRGYEPDF